MTGPGDRVCLCPSRTGSQDGHSAIPRMPRLPESGPYRPHFGRPCRRTSGLDPPHSRRVMSHTAPSLQHWPSTDLGSRPCRLRFAVHIGGAMERHAIIPLPHSRSCSSSCCFCPSNTKTGLAEMEGWAGIKLQTCLIAFSTQTAPLGLCQQHLGAGFDICMQTSTVVVRAPGGRVSAWIHRPGQGGKSPARLVS
jgi:hypothetical protein